MKRWIKALVVVISTCLYIMALTQDAFSYYGWEVPPEPVSEKFMSPWFCVVFGPFGMAVSRPANAWLANPFWFTSLVLIFTFPKMSLPFSGIALLFALLFLLGGKVPVDEAGGMAQIAHCRAGYWLWLSAISVQFLGCVFAWQKAEV